MSTAQTPFQRVVQQRASMAVKRCHVMRTLRQQTVGEHSGAVAMLVALVAPQASAQLLRAALHHDMHERATGDMPTTAKWMFPDLKAAMSKAEEQWNRENDYQDEDLLSPRDFQILRFCDYMEFLLWCSEEYELGNRFIVEGIVNIIGALDGIGAPTEIAGSLYQDARAFALQQIGNQP